MKPELPLDKMTVEEKLQVIEIIWEDLHRSTENIPAPAWHEDVLLAREKRIRDGASSFTDWDDAKRSIRDATK